MNAGRLVQVQLQRREDLLFGLGRELSDRFLGPRQAAPGNGDLAPALSGKSAGCRITEPGGGAGDERDECSMDRSIVRSTREAPRGVPVANF